MKEQEYMKITGGIDERFVNEYPANSGRKVTSLKKRATIGIIVVYMPLMFWPGIMGKFIKYIPI